MTSSGPLVAIPSRAKGCCVALAPGLDAGTTERLAIALKAASDPTRIQMLHMLKSATEPICICDLTTAFEQRQPTISHHMGRLREAGFVRSVKHGLWSFYSLDEGMPAEARAVLSVIP